MCMWYAVVVQIRAFARRRIPPLGREARRGLQLPRAAVERLSESSHPEGGRKCVQMPLGSPCRSDRGDLLLCSQEGGDSVQADHL